MKIAILIPCYNEETTIGKVVNDFHRELPEADIYVYDNASEDDTFTVAEGHGAVCRKESNRGKGNVIRRMFKDILADVYVMVDGDDTYDSSSVHSLIQSVKKGADMAVGYRTPYVSDSRVRKYGNKFLNYCVNRFFYVDKSVDLLSGYRGFSRRFVKNIRLETEHFEIETEMTIKAYAENYNVVSVSVNYRNRPSGSFSKLNVVKDGLAILGYIIRSRK